MTEIFQQNTVRLYPTVGYDEAMEDRKQDIYVPPASMKQDGKSFPVVVFVHGGAWHLGSKEASRYTCMDLAQAGYVTVAPRYSLSSMSNVEIDSILTFFIVIFLLFALTSKSMSQFLLIVMAIFAVSIGLIAVCAQLPRQKVCHPQHIQDVAQSVAWVQKHIAEYEGDANSIFVMGHSAGGHLATLLCTNEYYLQAAGGQLDRIRGCISLSGVYSDKRLQETNIGKQLLVNSFGDRKVYYDAFPIYNISDRTPPMLLINAGHDISLKRHTLDFHYALKQNGVYVETVYFNNRSHFNVSREWGPHQRNAECLEKINGFVNFVLQR